MKTKQYVWVSFITVMSVLGGVAGNLVSDYIRTSLEPYRHWVQWGFIATLIVAIIGAVINEHRPGSSPAEPQIRQPGKRRIIIICIVGFGTVAVLSFLWLCSFPQAMITHVYSQPVAQNQVELIAGDRKVELLVRGKIEGCVLSGSHVYVAVGKSGDENSLFVEPAERTGDFWETTITLNAPGSDESFHYKLVPLIANKSPDIPQRQRAFRQGEIDNRVVTLTVKTATLRINSIIPAGAYATLKGEARNLPDKTKLRIRTQLNGSNNFWEAPVEYEVAGDKWEAREVPMRESNRRVGQAMVRVVSSPTNNTYVGEQIVSNAETYSIPPPEVVITNINRRPVTGRCQLEPNAENEVGGLARNLLDTDTIWAGIRGPEGPVVVEVEPKDRRRIGEGLMAWSKKIGIGSGARFTVTAGYFNRPGAGSSNQFDREGVQAIECRSNRR